MSLMAERETVWAFDRTNDPRLQMRRDSSQVASNQRPSMLLISKDFFLSDADAPVVEIWGFRGFSFPRWMESYPWLMDAIDLERKGDGIAALRIVYSIVNDWLVAGKIERVNDLLDVADVDDLSVDMLLAFLTLTLRFHSKMPSRGEFFKRAKNALQRRGADRPGLLTGLG